MISTIQFFETGKIMETVKRSLVGRCLGQELGVGINIWNSRDIRT